MRDDSKLARALLSSTLYLGGILSDPSDKEISQQRGAPPTRACGDWLLVLTVME